MLLHVFIGVARCFGQAGHDVVAHVGVVVFKVEAAGVLVHQAIGHKVALVFSVRDHVVVKADRQPAVIRFIIHHVKQHKKRKLKKLRPHLKIKKKQ